MICIDIPLCERPLSNASSKVCAAGMVVLTLHWHPTENADSAVENGDLKQKSSLFSTIILKVYECIWYSDVFWISLYRILCFGPSRHCDQRRSNSEPLMSMSKALVKMSSNLGKLLAPLTSRWQLMIHGQKNLWTRNYKRILITNIQL